MINPYLNGTLFQASDKGEIWNKNFRKLTPRPDTSGYLVIRDDEGKAYFAHEVVYASFNEQPKDMIVLFKDGDKTNLNLSNLQGVRINDPDLVDNQTYLRHFARRQFINDEEYAQAVYAARLKRVAPQAEPEPKPLDVAPSKTPKPKVVAEKKEKPKTEPKPTKPKSKKAKEIAKGVGGFRNRLISD